MNTKKIETHYKLLRLIYEEKTSGILTDQALRESLNDLMKHELITIYNNKLKLTERGKAAMKNGINTVLTKVRSKKSIQYLEDKESKNLLQFMVTIAVMLFTVLLFLVLI